MFTYCPTCKNTLENNANHYSCPACGFDYYFNANPSSGVILINNKNQIYLGLRTQEPKSGMWELPGGFINLHESAEDGVMREIKEELGIGLDNLSFFKSYSNDYFYKGTQYYPLDLFFVSKVNLDEIKPTDADEFSEGRFFDFDKIPFEKLAFESNKKVLIDYSKSIK
jgi:ADP-ribose pyrophosphatase YjhB (NUDIX family)